MSQRQLLDLTEALLKDDVIGLRTTVERLAATVLDGAGDPNPPSGDFEFVRWALPGNALRPTTRGNIMLRPRAWRPNQRYIGTNLREATCVIDIGFETFAASPKDIETEVTLVATGVAQCIDQLRPYSDAHNGTVCAVVDPLVYQFGAFEGPTSNGFIVTVILTELSEDD